MTVNRGVDVVHVGADVLERFYAFAARHPGDKFTITSGHRDYDVSAAQSASGVVAPPGMSLHRRDPSPVIDVVADGEPIGTRFTQFELGTVGLWTHVPNDPVHLAPVGVLG